MSITPKIRKSESIEPKPTGPPNAQAYIQQQRLRQKKKQATKHMERQRKEHKAPTPTNTIGQQRSDDVTI